MIAAEQWYEYQENYQKYGFDMKPPEPEKPVRRKGAVITAKDRMRLVGLLIAAGVLCIGLIVATAYAASIQYDINKIAAANSVLQMENENLSIQIDSANNIQTIEAKAMKLGMVYPKKNQIVYLNKGKAPNAEVGAATKAQTYN